MLLDFLPQLCLLASILLSENSILVHSEANNKVVKGQVETWEEALDVLLLDARSKPIEQVDQVRRLLALLGGRTVGPFKINDLIELDRADRSKCSDADFDKFNAIQESIEKYVKTLRAYFAHCLKRQVEACKFEFNFKRRLALLDHDVDEYVRPLGEFGSQDEGATEAYGRSEVADLRLATRNISKLLKMFTKFENVTEVQEQRDIIKMFVEKLKGFCSKARELLEADLRGALRDPANSRDRHLAKWHRAFETCRIIDQNYIEIRVQISKQWEEEKAKRGGSLSFVIRLLGGH